MKHMRIECSECGHVTLRRADARAAILRELTQPSYAKIVECPFGGCEAKFCAIGGWLRGGAGERLGAIRPAPDQCSLQTVEALRVPPSWMYERTRRRTADHIPVFGLGKYWRFREANVLAWFKR